MAMQKEWEKFQTEFKKLQPKLKSVKLAEGEKIKKQLVADLKTAWDMEDIVRDAIAKAKENGVTGSKLADLMKDAEFSKAVGNWKKATAAHKSQIKALSDFCGEAAKWRDDLKKKADPVIKDVKKSKAPPAAKKDINKTLDAAQAELDLLEKAVGLYGTLKMPELFYAAKEDKTLEAIVKKVAKKASAKELPKILDDAVSKKNLKLVSKMEEKIY